MKQTSDFTRGGILAPLLRFALPVLGALILQVTYGAVDLLVVGQFGTAADVSAVSTGSQLMHTITTVITGLAMGATVLLGQRIGEGRSDKAGDVIGGAVWLFGALGLAVTVAVPLAAKPLCTLMQAPAEAFRQTVLYVSVCAGGALFIVAYNLLGSIFRGMGDSATPLLAVAIACVVNIAGDLVFVAVLGMAAAGAALATVLAQAISVVLCLALIRRRGLPFAFGR
ncbi:MAG: MATE family efflux transporter, partial [Gemmiger sp.]